MNQYVFCGSNPVNFVDPEGMILVELAAVALGVAGVIATLTGASLAVGLGLGLYGQELKEEEFDDPPVPDPIEDTS